MDGFGVVGSQWRGSWRKVGVDLYVFGWIGGGLAGSGCVLREGKGRRPGRVREGRRSQLGDVARVVESVWM